MQETWTSDRGGIDLYLDLGTGRSRRAALETGLRQAIREGRLAQGQVLPSSRALALQLGVARGTVVEAYTQLAAEGFLRSRPGAGTTVAHAEHPRADAAATHVARRISADFRLGRPDLSAFPRTEWLRAQRRALNVTAHSEFGPANPRGSARLRAILADYLGRVRGVLTSSDNIVICSGFTQGLRLVCDALAANGTQTIALENPCLPDHRAVARASRLAVTPIEVDARGACPASLRETVAAAVLTPAHQAPLGVTLDADRRNEFVEMARARGFYIVEDDYDGEFRYDRHPVGALQGLSPEHVVYAGSTSKSLAPGLRLGWLVLPSSLVDAVVDAKRRADRGTDILTQLALAELIEAGDLDRHIRRMRRRYRYRRDALVQTLNECAPAVTVHGVAAGLHTVIQLPDAISEAEFCRSADDNFVALTGLTPFWHNITHGSTGIVIGFGAPFDHDYTRALDALGQLVSNVVATHIGNAR